MQVPDGTVLKVLDVTPLMLNYQDVFITGESWARARFKHPSLSFERFWWSKVRRYDLKNSRSSRFWREADFTDRQATRYLFGASSSSQVGIDDDIDVNTALEYLFGQTELDLGSDGSLVVPKEEPSEGNCSGGSFVVGTHRCGGARV